MLALHGLSEFALPGQIPAKLVVVKNSKEIPWKTASFQSLAPS